MPQSTATGRTVPLPCPLELGQAGKVFAYRHGFCATVWGEAWGRGGFGGLRPTGPTRGDRLAGKRSCVAVHRIGYNPRAMPLPTSPSFRTRSVRLTVATLACGLALIAGSGLPAADVASPAGLWRTFDDKTGRERGAVRIWEQGGVFYGTIVGTVDPAEATHRCDKCRDDRKGRPIIGLDIIRGMKPEGDRWAGGEILDPETGQTYRCSMRLEDGGRKLVVRGYLGISLLGRSQTWLRAE